VQGMIVTVDTAPCKLPVFCQILAKIKFYRQSLEKMIQLSEFMKNLQEGAELFHVKEGKKGTRVNG
jgi:hypothetical protein